MQWYGSVDYSLRAYTPTTASLYDGRLVHSCREGRVRMMRIITYLKCKIGGTFSVKRRVCPWHNRIWLVRLLQVGKLAGRLNLVNPHQGSVGIYYSRREIGFYSLSHRYYPASDDGDSGLPRPHGKPDHLDVFLFGEFPDTGGRYSTGCTGELAYWSTIVHRWTYSDQPDGWCVQPTATHFRRGGCALQIGLGSVCALVPRAGELTLG